MTDFINIKNARLHNLKNIHVEIPIGKITLVTGVSGSGKSSLIIDLLGKVSRHRYLQLLGDTAMTRGSIELKEEEYLDLLEPVCPSLILRGHVQQRNPASTVGSVSGLNRFIKNLFGFSGKYVCPSCGYILAASQLEEIVADVEEKARDKRVIIKAPVDLPEDREERSLVLTQLQSSGFIRVEIGGQIYFLDEELDRVMDALGDESSLYLIVDRLKLTGGKRHRLFDSLKTALDEGDERVVCDIEEEKGKFVSHFFSTKLWCPTCSRLYAFPGHQKHKSSSNKSDAVEAELLLNGKRLDELLSEPVSELHHFILDWLEAIEEKDEWLAPLLEKVTSLVQSMMGLEIGHLEPSRPITAISSGEFLKLRLSSLLAQRLTGVLYVLDEPVSVLPPRERQAICALIQGLKNSGNTVVMIEHAPEAVGIADYFLEIGPEGGQKGGKLIRAGWLDEDNKDSLVVALSHDAATKDKRIRQSKDKESEELLLDVVTPLTGKIRAIKLIQGGINVICGPTGSGKTLMLSGIAAELAKVFPSDSAVLNVPQGAIFRSKYSIPATVLSVFGGIRTLFSRTRQARSYGLTANMFSLAKKGGRCEACKGTGSVEKEGFGYSLTYQCPVCEGARYNAEILDITYKGRNIKEVLDMSLSEAADFFSGVSSIRKPLEMGERVGIGYVLLGQPLTSLSTGEAQRLKIAAHLTQKGIRRKSFLLLDQPTAGLHPKDVASLIDFFSELVTLGSTLIIVENNPAIIELADITLEVR